MTAEDLVPVVALGALFTVAILLAVAVYPTFQASEVRAFEDPGDPTNVLIWVAVILVFTGIILVLAWKNLDRLIQLIVLSAVVLTIVYATWPLFRLVVGVGPATVGALAVALALGVALYKHPEWYVVDAAGVLMAAGASALFGVSLVPGLVIVLMVALAVYDAIAVYRTKHMVSLADTALTQHLPIMLVIPKTLDYSFLEEGDLEDQIEEGGEREALFMGLGDVVIPAILVVSGAAFAPDVVGRFGPAGPVVVALVTLAGALVGLAGLMVLIRTGRAQAGLPLLNGGSIVGYVAGLWWAYGTLPSFTFF